jgi:hypothetical protein
MWSSYDDAQYKMQALGKFELMRGSRVIVAGATSVAGRWHEAISGAGMGGPLVLTGTAGLGAALSSATPGALPAAMTTVGVAGDERKLVSFKVSTPQALVCPGEGVLLDLLYIYPSCAINTPTGLSNAAAKPTRMGTGAGVKIIAIITAALGAANTTVTFSYTNQDGVAGRTGTIMASANSLPAGALLTGGVAGQLGGPYANLAAGDSGVRSIESYTVASGTTGTVAFLLVREIADAPLIAANAPGQNDYAFNTPGWRKLEDAACPAIIVNIGGALTTGQALNFGIAFGWG